ncbi:hypothetical protein Tco_1040703 [Tanacetum coccineum]
MISNRLQPRTCNDELSEPTMWQAVIGQPSPRVSKWDPPDTSLQTLAGQRVNDQRVNGQRVGSTVNGLGQRVTTCRVGLPRVTT